MESISGASNWKLTIQENPEEITILRAVTCDREAILPETLLGKPVTVLAHHALAAGAHAAGNRASVNHTAGNHTAGNHTARNHTAGDRAAGNRASGNHPAGDHTAEAKPLLVTGAPTKAEWDNANLRTLSLPRTLQRIGNYAFLNCARLQKLVLYDNIQMWGGSVFMNCRKLNTFSLTREQPGQGETLAYLNDVLTNELDITVTGADGNTARLIFPEYLESYEENCPAHHFDLKIFGPGYPYHHCFSQKRLDLAVYDRLWPNFLRMDHEPETALKIAWYRLRCPAELKADAKEQYVEYLKAHAEAALELCLDTGDTEGLCLALRETAPPRPVLEQTCARARAMGRTQAVAVLLQEQRRTAPKTKTFDL